MKRTEHTVLRISPLLIVVGRMEPLLQDQFRTGRVRGRNDKGHSMRCGERGDGVFSCALGISFEEISLEWRMEVLDQTHACSWMPLSW